MHTKSEKYIKAFIFLVILYIKMERNAHITYRNRITKNFFKLRRWGLERLTFCHKFYENPLFYKKVIDVLKIPIV